MRGRGVAFALAFMLAWIVAAASIASAAPGNVDPTFGTNGWAFVEVHDYDGIDDAVRQPDGGILVAGTHASTMTVWRVLADGTLDPSFGVDGEVAVPFKRSSGASAITLQPDGNIVVAGFAGRKGTVARLLPDGALDPTFGSGDGRAAFRPAGFAFASGKDVVMLDDGGLIVGLDVTRASGAPSGALLIRLNADGSIDSGFGVGGTIEFERRVVGDMTLDGSGSVIVSLASQAFRRDHFFVATLDPDGSLLPEFGGDGIRRYLVRGVSEPSHVVVDDASRIVIAMGGFSNRCFTGGGAVVRLTSVGEFDTTFSDDGVALRRCILQNRIVIQADGSIVVGGSVQSGGGAGEYYPSLARITANGDVDGSFGEDGVVVAAPRENYWSGTRGLFIQEDGKLLLVAGAIYDAGFAVGRFLTA